MSRSSRKKTPIKGVIKSAEIVGSPGKTTIEPFKEKDNFLINGTFKDIIPNGSDNLFPQSIAYLLRKSMMRGIINSQVTYLTGKRFTCDEGSDVEKLVNECNGDETLRSVARKFFVDYNGQGTSYLQIVTDASNSFFYIYHNDATEVRKGRNKNAGYWLIHPDWKDYENSKKLTKKIKNFPDFEEMEDDDSGYLYSMIQVKDYEPEFEHYGTPNWLSGLDAASIAYKTNKWNISRLDNGHKNSAILFIDEEFETEESEIAFKEKLDETYTGEGTQGKVMVVKRANSPDQKSGTELVQFEGSTDADWKDLKNMAIEEMLVASNWMPTLSGINTSSGFDTARILNEYHVALNNYIQPTQEVFLETIDKICDYFGVDSSSLDFVNKPPVLEKSDYMKIWEARKVDGLDYDEEDEAQQVYLADLKSKQKEAPTDNAIKSFFKRLKLTK